MQAYSNPKRENDPHSLSDVEVWQVTANRKLRPDFDYSAECGYSVCASCGKAFYPMELECEDEPSPCCGVLALEPGWYWWTCLPGCLPDSEPNGPFTTRAEAIADAQENADVDDDEEAAQ